MKGTRPLSERGLAPGGRVDSLGTPASLARRRVVCVAPGLGAAHEAQLLPALVQHEGRRRAGPAQVRHVDVPYAALRAVT
jgi:hypothetical protein